MSQALMQFVDLALQKRVHLIKEPYNTAFRLINGFTENIPDLMVEVFGKTIVYNDYSTDTGDDISKLIDVINPMILKRLPFLVSGIVKHRWSKVPKKRNGEFLFGTELDTFIKENGCLYAIDLTMNRDSSFYLDTKDLRYWLNRNLKNKTVLNTFAYTGSLGIAALCGGAKEVIQLDLNRVFLDVAKRSAKLNGKEAQPQHYQTGDFWSRINQYKKNGLSFDCVILDPPVYSKTQKGIIDIVKNYHKLINKVRPIINHNGYLVTINNALFQSGDDHKAVLDELCKSDYLSIEDIISVPENCIGDARVSKDFLPADPAPYVHSTKITLLKVTRKQI